METTPCGHDVGQLYAKKKGLEADSPSEPSEGTSSADTLVLDFWPQELQENKFLCLWLCLR